MDMLAEIKRNMAFMGWQGPSETGFTHKEDADGKAIVRELETRDAFQRQFNPKGTP